MKIVITSPLYPPDIAQPAPYVKEVAKQLSKNHTVTIVTYGSLPEKVEKVNIIAISKRNPLFFRLIAYTHALWQAAQTADILYTENGASVELPAGIVALLTHKPLIMHIGDIQAHQRTQQNSLLRLIQNFACWRAHTLLTDIPLQKPEILPFKPLPEGAIEEYTSSWKKHLTLLESSFTKYVSS